uniref:RHS repeat-associated core domain-containing protein n=1 Tax=Bacteroides bouchesdurhonensis TaxID=1841855 RepID=UPI0022E71249
QTSSTGYGLIDNLNLTYNGNQLQAVNDNATSSAYGNGTDFKDGTHQTTEYTYDKNGNLIKDLNKDISKIGYNLLNLPDEVTFANGNSIRYEYTADGTKLRTVHKTGATTLTTDYCGNAVYENGVLRMLLNEAGYVSFPDRKFHFYLKDHQGNTRVVADKDGNVEETNAYYPFGGTFTSTASVQPYKYNGKELDAKNGLNWYDYGARHYDAAIGRWHVVDPMSEKYYSSSLYMYCANNPIKYIDPTGLAWRLTYDEDHDGKRKYNGYEWVSEEESYNEDGSLKKGLYAQAIFFSDNGTFDSKKSHNIGSSTATVYLADGTTLEYDASTNPSDSEAFATVPEGIYEANVGIHHGSKRNYTALKMRDIGAKSQTLELGIPNPAYQDGRTFATGIDIHYAGKNNFTGTINDGKNGVSQGCLLIDINAWSNFISNFNNNIQRSNPVSVTVSRTFSTPVNGNRLPAFNFIMNGSRSNFFNSKIK